LFRIKERLYLLVLLLPFAEAEISRRKAVIEAEKNMSVAKINVQRTIDEKKSKQVCVSYPFCCFVSPRQHSSRSLEHYFVPVL